MMSVSVIYWWYFLCAVAGFNVLAWFLSAVALKRRSHLWTPEEYSTRRALLFLSAVYVFGCAFRSAFPVYDIPRICVIDSWLSCVMIGRAVATVAEMSFVAQWALMLREISRATGSVIGKFSSAALVPLIAIAETCSWYSVLTTSNIGHVAEESIWGFAVALLVVSVATMLPRCTAARRSLLVACCVAGSIYVAYMFLVDVPMYWSRWIAQDIDGRHILSVAQGAHDASVHWVVSHRWQDWKNEVVWMSLYFSVAVWISLALVHTPAHETRLVIGQRRRTPARISLGLRAMAEPRI